MLIETMIQEALRAEGSSNLLVLARHSSHYQGILTEEGEAQIDERLVVPLSNVQGTEDVSVFYLHSTSAWTQGGVQIKNPYVMFRNGVAGIELDGGFIPLDDLKLRTRAMVERVRDHVAQGEMMYDESFNNAHFDPVYKAALLEAWDQLKEQEPYCRWGIKYLHTNVWSAISHNMLPEELERSLVAAQRETDSESAEGVADRMYNTTLQYLFPNPSIEPPSKVTLVVAGTHGECMQELVTRRLSGLNMPELGKSDALGNCESVVLYHPHGSDVVHVGLRDKVIEMPYDG